MRHLSRLFRLLSGFILAAACGGKAQTSGGDGDGDGPNGSGANSGDGELPGDGDGDGDGSGGTVGDGDEPGDGDSSNLSCEPGDVRLCELLVDHVCTGVQLCAETGAAWGACICPDGEQASGTGGAQSAGGAGGAGAVEEPEPTCSDVIACGGDVRGQWEVGSSCLAVTGKFDISALGVGCNEAAISGALDVSGELEFLEDSRFVDETTTSGDLALRLEQACLDVSGTVVTCESISAPLAYGAFSSVKCLDSPNGGCVCGARVDQAGGLRHVSHDVSTGGLYTEIDETLTLSNTEQFTYSYCASARSLVMTPTGTGNIQTIHGTVMFLPRPASF